MPIAAMNLDSMIGLYPGLFSLCDITLAANVIFAAG